MALLLVDEMGALLVSGAWALFWSILPLLLAGLVVNLPLCLLGAPLFFNGNRLGHGGNAWVRSLVIFLLLAVLLILCTAGRIIFSQYGTIAFYTTCLLSSVGGLLVEKARNAKA